MNSNFHEFYNLNDSFFTIKFSMHGGSLSEFVCGAAKKRHSRREITACLNSITICWNVLHDMYYNLCISNTVRTPKTEKWNIIKFTLVKLSQWCLGPPPLPPGIRNFIINLFFPRIFFREKVYYLTPTPLHGVGILWFSFFFFCRICFF